METKVELETYVTSFSDIINQIHQHELLTTETKLAIVQLIKNDENRMDSLLLQKEDSKSKDTLIFKKRNNFSHENKGSFFPAVKKQNIFRNVSISSLSSSSSGTSSSSNSPKTNSNDANQFPLTPEVAKKYLALALKTYTEEKKTEEKKAKAKKIEAKKAGAEKTEAKKTGAKKTELGFVFNEFGQYEVLVTSVLDNVKFFLVDHNDKEALGEGVSAKVHRAWNMETKELLAAKIYKSTVRNTDIDNEVKNLATKNKFHAFFSLPDSPRILLMNHSGGRELLTLLYVVNGRDKHEEPIYINKNIFAPFITLKCVYKLLEEVLDLHQTKFRNKNYYSNYEELDGLLHRDIKPANVLVEMMNKDDVVLNLIDFTDVIPNRKNGNNSNTCCGSNGYTPPELIGTPETRKPYTQQSDFFETGVTIAEIITSANYQAGIQNHMRQYDGVTFNDYWKIEQMQEIMQDVFSKKYVLKIKPSLQTIDQYIQEVLYKHIIFPVLCELVISMTRLVPTSRLEGSSLKMEIKKLKEIEKICYCLAKNIHNLVENAVDSHHHFKHLDKYMQGKLASFGMMPLEPMAADINELINSLTDSLEPSMEFSITSSSF